MSTITDKLGELESQVIETVKAAQEPVVEGVRSVVGFLDERLPELPAVAGLDRLPSASEVLEQQFTFAGDLLDAQRELVAALFEALSPLTEQLRPAAAPKAKSKAKATKAAA